MTLEMTDALRHIIFLTKNKHNILFSRTFDVNKYSTRNIWIYLYFYIIYPTKLAQVIKTFRLGKQKTVYAGKMVKLGASTSAAMILP